MCDTASLEINCCYTGEYCFVMFVPPTRVVLVIFHSYFVALHLCDGEIENFFFFFFWGGLETERDRSGVGGGYMVNLGKLDKVYHSVNKQWIFQSLCSNF